MFLELTRKPSICPSHLIRELILNQGTDTLTKLLVLENIVASGRKGKTARASLPTELSSCLACSFSRPAGAPRTAPRLVLAGLRAQHRAHPAHVRRAQLPTVDRAAHGSGGGTCAVHSRRAAAAGNRPTPAPPSRTVCLTSAARPSL